MPHTQAGRALDAATTPTTRATRAAIARPRGGDVLPLPLLVVAGWTTLGLLRIALRYAFGGISPDAWPALAGAPLMDGAIWATVTLVALRVVRRLPWRTRRAGPTVAAHAVFAVAVAALEATALRELLALVDSWTPPAWHVTFLNRLDLNVFSYLAAVGVAYALDYRTRARDGAAAAAALESRLATAQLHVLTMQLQPHFLFNTLHTISELVHADAAAARRTLGNLAALFRMSLDGAAAQEVSLDEELRFLAAYVDIQLTRFGDRLTMTTDVDAETRRAIVPHLVLQPLVENAIRHGTSRRAAPGHVAVTARRVRADDGRVGDRRVGDGADALEILVRDDGPGLGARPPLNGSAAVATRRGGDESRGNGGGIGIGNTRARLRQLYGEAHVFELVDAEGGGVVARVRVPWRTEATTELARLASSPVDDAYMTPAAGTTPPPSVTLRVPDVGAAGTDVAAMPPASVPDDDGPTSTWGARRWAALVFAAWTTYGLLAAQELHLMYVVEKRTPPGWGKLVALSLTDAWGWAVWTALVAWLARRVPLGRHNWRWLVPAHLALAHLVAFAHLWFLRATGAVGSSYPFVDPRNLTILAWDVFAYLVVLAFAHAVVYRARWRRREREAARLAAAVAAAELEVLRWRLQPRFLLDTLATVSRLVDREVERADRMVARLGDLLRSLLPYAAEHHATLRDELARLEAYVDLVALRDGRPVTMQLDVSAELLDVPTPPMVLQPMAERELGLATGGTTPLAGEPACLWVFALREGGRLVLVLRGDGVIGASQRVELALPGAVAASSPHRPDARRRRPDARHGGGAALAGGAR